MREESTIPAHDFRLRQVIPTRRLIGLALAQLLGREVVEEEGGGNSPECMQDTIGYTYLGPYMRCGEKMDPEVVVGIHAPKK